MKLSVVGLGKLGSPLAAVLASKGHTVIGVDINAAFVDAINAGRAPVVEPQLQELITAHRQQLSATQSYADAITNSDLTFIIVPTPSNEQGVFSTAYVIGACQKIGQVLATKNSYHVVVVTATVMPGATGGEITAALETSSGKKCGVEFGLCYSPEFIALGSVVRNLLKPDFVLIGESDSRAGDVLSDVYRSVCDNNPPIARMNFVNAELAKISVNTFVTTKISYANMLAEICEHLPGANVDIVTSAIGLDQRIGSKYLKGATGYGGPCFPRDNVAFSRLAEMIGASAEIAQATDLINRRQAERLASLIGEHLSDGATVGILGLAYKPDTPVIEESQGVALARFLLERGSAVVVYDPLAMEGARTILGDRPVYANSARECAQQVDALVLMIPCEEFKAIEPADLNRNHGYRVVVLDSWRILNREQFEPVCHYINLGVGLEHNVPVTQSTR